MKVLLVDDDKIDRELIIRTLKKINLDATIVEASTVDEGLSLNSKESFDIILLDYNMPGRNGLDMIIELQSNHVESSTAIIMMSASSDEQLALDCIKAGAQDFLIKSKITALDLRSSVLHAQTRYELEKKLLSSYKKVKRLAESDPLTGLANRYLFDQTLKINLANNLRNQHKIALLILDLDNFKNVNDTYGHDAGDTLLKQVVLRIKNCLRENESFARLGGDEFAISLNNLEAAQHASSVASRIIKVLGSPFDIAGTEITSSASIGISIYPDNGSTTEDLFKHSDIAMYRAKSLGRNQVCFFQDDMQKEFSHRIVLEKQLRDGIKNKEFLLHYQPVINSANDQVTGFEALIRWEFQGKLRPPDQFIPIAEETRQIIEIGRWVLHEAISTLSHWNNAGDREYSMAINMSPVQLNDKQLTSHIQKCLAKYKVKPNLVEIELTETALLCDTAETRAVIIKLHEMGCRISLDDFGTGFSSVSHLQKFPIDIVKIDRSLMLDVNSINTGEVLVRGLNAMMKILGLNVIAEGVETKKHADFCSELGIPRIQGYYYSKPLSRFDIEERYIFNLDNNTCRNGHALRST